MNQSINYTNWVYFTKQITAPAVTAAVEVIVKWTSVSADLKAWPATSVN